jgi:hypothetical protein
MAASRKPHSTKGAAKRKAAAPKRNAVTVEDRIRLGENASNVKSNTTPGQWRHIVQGAHAGGYSVSGYLSDVPAALKERTQSSLHDQAMSQTQEAFAPQQKELDFQTQMTNNIRAKRAADEDSYAQWEAQQTSMNAAAMQQAQQNYQNFVDKTSGAVQSAANNIVAQATAQAQNGALGDVVGSASLQGAREHAAALAASAQNQSINAHAGEPRVAMEAAGFAAASRAGHLMRRAALEGDWGKATATINADRLKMDSDRAAATIKNYSDLLKQEMDKANANRNFQVTSDQLAASTEKTKLQHSEFLIGQRTSRRNATIAANTSRANATLAANTSRANNRATNATSASNAQLSHQDRVAARQAQKDASAANRAFQAAENAKNRAAKTGAGDPTRQVASNKAIEAVDTIADILRRQQKGPKGRPGSGYLFDHNAGQWRPARQVLYGMGASQAQVDAGLAHARGQLIPPRLKQILGILG